MNRYQFIGHVGKDADTRKTDNGSTAINFNVAVTESYKSKNGDKVENTTWVSCTYWRKADQSTALSQYLTKGVKVYIEGAPSVRSWINKDGEAQASLELRVDKIELLTTKQPQQSVNAAENTNEVQDDLSF